MTSPIAAIGTIAPLAAPAATAAPTAGASTIAGRTGAGNSSFDAALSTAMGANPLASLAGSGMTSPTTNNALATLVDAGLVTPTSATSGSGVINSATTAPAGGVDLAGSLANGFDAVQAAQHDADTLAVQAAAGQIVDPAQLTIAMTKAQLMTQVAAAVQSKAVTAFNTIMSLQA